MKASVVGVVCSVSFLMLSSSFFFALSISSTLRVSYFRLHSHAQCSDGAACSHAAPITHGWRMTKRHGVIDLVN